ncbi:MAG: 16S rRNA (cytidine(1402)-2'-O)-methyltransferase [Desulfobulbaceae bacterium]|nr:16S rRNA (cytidine(1402)-2'-O)-methyltransferase [Desulfobulbaceae bacterium]
MQEHKVENRGTLYIVPTPIGNLEDITLRAIRILKEVDHICAEDTRHSKKLLNHFGIATPLISYYREKEAEKSGYIINLLQDGKNIALISDAGTPAISDPGAILVQRGHQAGITIVPLPGASAVTTALSGSGITGDGFLFLGFPPSKKGQRQKFIQSLVNCEYPVVLYESPRRIEGLLQDSIEILGDRNGFWARELTKSFEELLPGKLTDLLEKSAGTNKGEFVLIICPGEKEQVTGETLEDLLIWYRDNSELSLKDVSKKLSGDLGMSRSQVYQQALSLWDTKK